MITINDMRDRLLLLCPLITLPDPLTTGTAYRDEEECSWAEADLPAYVVKAGARGAEYQYSDSNVSYFTTRDIRIGLYIAHICDESYTKDMDQVDFAEEVAQTVIHFFAARPTLSMDGDEGIVEEARIVSATAPHTMATKGAVTKNRGIQFRMVVRFLNFARQT
jgi:hypothetical protein